KRPIALDLFCGAGGASMGLHRAGFDVVGVDIESQPRYPFTFLRTDVTRMSVFGYPFRLDQFDFIWASPPCQGSTALTRCNGNAEDWPDLIPGTRALLKAAGRPYCIENVEGAPLEHPMMLCGTMFPGLRVLRHRIFECSFFMLAPAHADHPAVHTFD